MNIISKIVTPERTIEILKRYGFNIKKKYGQNFLLDSHVIDKIMHAAMICKDDYILEIGPGIGSLTEFLCESANHVTAVEIDNKLIDILHCEVSSYYNNLTIINGDFLKLDIGRLYDQASCGSGVKLKVVANLPYYISSAIILRLLELHEHIDSITVMLQKELADRLRAVPGTKDYGSLTAVLSYYCDISVVAAVPPNCFMPRPDVSSAVVNLVVRDKPVVSVKDEDLFFKLIRAAFAQRRKTLVNCVFNTMGLELSKHELADALGRMGLPHDVRGESLSVSQLGELSDILREAPFR